MRKILLGLVFSFLLSSISFAEGSAKEDSLFVLGVDIVRTTGTGDEAKTSVISSSKVSSEFGKELPLHMGSASSYLVCVRKKETPWNECENNVPDDGFVMSIRMVPVKESDLFVSEVSYIFSKMTKGVSMSRIEGKGMVKVPFGKSWEWTFVVPDEKDAKIVVKLSPDIYKR